LIGRIVEVASDQRHLSASKGFLLVSAPSDAAVEFGRVPLDDIAAVVANAHGLSYTNNLLVALAERGVPFVLCGANHNVAGVLWPINGHSQQAKRFDAQIAASKPMHKRLWTEIVRAKLEQQASVLEAVGAATAPLHALAKRVRSGDPDNVEAQGARRYWTLLFGEAFRRDREAGGVNAMLNYGYTVLRAAVARAVVAAGLHPTLGLHHKNENNAMRLVDDLMEPFRPLLDLRVWQMLRHGHTEITPATKRTLVHTLFEDMHTAAGITPLMTCVQQLATSLALVYLNERASLELPLPGMALALAAAPADA
jgi:CRISPR-associated protein Cas1